MNNRGRIQAQGDGTQKSAPWSKNEDVTKRDGSEKVDNLESQLTSSEINKRQLAFQKARNRIDSSPPYGVMPFKKSYWNDMSNRKIRVDIEVIKGIAFIDNPTDN